MAPQNRYGDDFELQSRIDAALQRRREHLTPNQHAMNEREIQTLRDERARRANRNPTTQAPQRQPQQPQGARRHTDVEPVGSPEAIQKELMQAVNSAAYNDRAHPQFQRARNVVESLRQKLRQAQGR